MARLRPLVADDAGAQELRDLDLGLAGPVGAHQAHVLARAERPFPEDRFPARGDGDHDVAGERLEQRPRDGGADLVAGGCCDALVRVVEEDIVTPGGQRPRDGPSVDSGADDARADRAGQRQGLGGQDRGSSRPERGDGRRVEQCAQLSCRRVGEDDDAGHSRQAAGRVAGKGGDPLEDRVAAARRGHRPEVAVGSLDVDLGGHLPGAAGVLEERRADRLDGIGGADGGRDVGRREDRDRHGQASRRASESA